MIFILITFLAAFLIEGLGTAVSVIGLSTLFGANPIIIALAISLDVGKLVVVSLLYNHWKRMGMMMKSYAALASLVTMIITSAGAAGYLTGEFQKAILGTQETSLKVNVLKEQQAKYEERKKQIDAQIANLPEKTTVNQRIRLMKQFQDEQKALQAKIEDIDKQLPDLQIKQIGVEAKAGPILYISKAFEVPVEVAVKYVVLLIIFVFDPLAVFLMIAGNFLLAQRKKKPDDEPPPDDDDKEPVPEPEEPELPEMVAEIAEMVADPHAHAAVHIPNATTLEAMAEAKEMMAARAQREHPPRGVPSESFIPSVAVKSETLADEHERVRQFMDEPIKLNGEVIAGADPNMPALDEPIIEEPVVEPTSPSGPEVPPREQIHLHQLKPHRSSLNDAKGDEVVHFDQSPQHSVNHPIYRRQ